MSDQIYNIILSLGSPTLSPKCPLLLTMTPLVRPPRRKIAGGMIL